VSLSDRIRPNCEAAPWVVEEVKKLERDNAALRQERDSYRFRSEQIWGLRKEIQAALGVPADCEGEEALKRGLESIEALRSDKERLDWLESVSKDLICTADSLGVTVGVASNFQNYATNAATFRAAINAARKEAQP